MKLISERNTKNIAAVIVSVLLLVCAGHWAIAETVSFDISVTQDKVSLGSSIQLNLTFYGTKGVPAPRIDDIEGFKVRYMGPSSRLSIVNGKVSSSITHIYRLLAAKTGLHKIGPLSIDFDGDTYQSHAVMVEVVKGAIQPGATVRKQRYGSSEGLLDRVSLVLEAGKQTIYVNETIPVSIKLYVSNISMRDIRFPEFNHEGFSASEFGKPEQYREVKGGIPYEVLEFKTEIFATRPGEFVLGPATISGNMVVVKKSQRRHRSVFDDFFEDDMFQDNFNRYQTYPVDLKSDTVVINVMALPGKGRPELQKGAVGDFSFDVAVEPRTVTVGDPITIKMRISGTGNFNTVNVPRLETHEGLKVYDPQVTKQEEHVKIFEQILIPKETSVNLIPKVSFSYFDTERKIYRTIERGPFPVTVEKPEKEEQLKIIEMPKRGQLPIRKEILGRDIIYIKGSTGALTKKKFLYLRSKWFILFLGMPLVLLFAFIMIHKRSDRLKTDVRYARSLRATRKSRQALRVVKKYLANEHAGKFYDTVFKNMQVYFGDKFHMPTGGITADVVEHTMRAKNLDEEMVINVKEIFSECDMARYALSDIKKEDMEKTFGKLRLVIEYMERARL